MARHFSIPITSALAAMVALVLVAPQSDPTEGAIPNKAGVYRACLTKKTGAIRVVNYPTRQCAKGQRLIKWNAKGQPGAQGIQGIQGPQGPAGPADWNAIPNKPSGFADGVDAEGVTHVKLTRVLGPETVVNPGTTGYANAYCPAGSRVTGGGFWASSYANINLGYSEPAGALGGWNVAGVNTGGGSISLYAYAICMSVEPASGFTTAKKGFLPAKVKKAQKGRNRR